MSRPNPVLKTVIPGATLMNSGKVRDIYDAGEHLLFVTSDRISAFDVVMDQGIPGKGIVLTQISLFWFEQTGQIISNHVVSTNVEDFPAPFNRYPDLLKGRSMLVKKAQPLTVECIVRGYLAGSGWKEYQVSRSLHKQPLPPGLENASLLPETVFTPSTKAASGHDINISFEEMKGLIDPALAERVKDISLSLYQFGTNEALRKGIIIADTKFEFGLQPDGSVLLIDEIMTPDSSRFWPRERYQPGRNQDSLDKQYLRDWLETLDWDKTPPPPALPENVIRNTAAKYEEILTILTGKTIADVLG